MAEIHVLSSRDFRGCQAARLLTDLQSAQERGVDLGTRVPHIQASGGVLQQMADGLADMIIGLSPSMDQRGHQGQEVIRTLTTLLQEVRILANTAQCFTSCG